MSDLLIGFAAATVRVATPLALAAIGETISERGGVINLGIEGAMLGGALAAAVAATAAGPAAGMACAILAGVATSGVFAAVTIGAKADQIISGTAITLGMTGLTGVLARRAFGVGGAGLTIPTMTPVAVPGLSAIPLVGAALFNQPILTYVAYLSIPLAAWLLFRTRFGLELRAAGESVASASASGVRVVRVRTVATLIGGGMAGLAGATLVLAQVGTFSEKMTAGRGFIAIAIVVLGRWRPTGVAAAALLFGGASALQFALQASGTALPYQALIALPYLLALLVLGLAIGRRQAPAGLGRND